MIFVRIVPGAAETRDTARQEYAPGALRTEIRSGWLGWCQVMLDCDMIRFMVSLMQ